MRVTVDVELNDIAYEQDIHSLVAFVKAYLEDTFQVPVEAEINDLSYVDRVSLFNLIREGEQREKTR